MRRFTATTLAGLVSVLVTLLLFGNTVVTIQPKLATDPVSREPDDPAIWIHRGNPNLSLILGTNKTPAPDGALQVFGLDGRIPANYQRH